MKELQSLKPGEEVWLLITECSTYVEGDERSRTNPGHGYPAHTVYSENVEVIKSESVLEDKLKRAPNAYVLLKARRLKVTNEVKISIQ